MALFGSKDYLKTDLKLLNICMYVTTNVLVKFLFLLSIFSVILENVQVYEIECMFVFINLRCKQQANTIRLCTSHHLKGFPFDLLAV